MDNDDQGRVLVEIRDLLRQLAETQKTEAANNSEYRAAVSKAQDAAHSSYRQAASRQRREVSLWFALLISLVLLGGLMMSNEIDSLVRKAMRMANVPEFRP
jgi:uncharacterized membrane protein YdbT with pleckstrin-like domain